MRTWIAFFGISLAACSGDDGGKGADGDDTADTDTTPVEGQTLTGLWVGDCAPLEGSTTAEYATTTITELSLDLTDVDGTIQGTWSSVASQYTTTTTYVNTTTEVYPVSGTRSGADVSLVLDNGTTGYGYPSTLVGTVAGDTLTLALAIETPYYTLTADCTLGR